VVSDDAADRQLVNAAEAELATREAAVGDVEWTPMELAAFAAEHDALADRWDELAKAGDETAAQRDRAATDRDGGADDRDHGLRRDNATPGSRGYVERILAAGDRDDAAEDRLDARDDRLHSEDDRDRAAGARHQAGAERDVAIDAATANEHAEQELASLWQIIDTRQLIGQATGIWMERHDLTADRAFALLVKLSQKWHVKLAVAAAEIVGTRDPRVADIRLRLP
jgi:hypothetical protein